MIYEMRNTGYFFAGKLIPSILAVSTLLSCVSSESNAGHNAGHGGGAPAWYTEIHKVYPNEKYLAMRGMGSNEREARRNAAGELATLFRTKIDFDSLTTFRYAESESSSSTARGVDQSVRLSSNQEISGLEYSEPFRGAGDVHVVAYLDRDKVGKLYAERIADHRDKISELRRRGAKLSPTNEGTEELLAGFILYDYSVDLALRNQMLLEQLQIINKTAHDKVARTIDYNSVKLAGQRGTFASRLSFALNYSGDEKTIFLGENIADEMTRLGFVRRSDNNAKNGSALVLDVRLELNDVITDNRYANLAWDLQVSFIRKQNADGSGQQDVLLEFSQSGRESGVSRSRALTTLKRLLNERIENEFFSKVFAYFARFAGI